MGALDVVGRLDGGLQSATSRQGGKVVLFSHLKAFAFGSGHARLEQLALTT